MTAPANTSSSSSSVRRPENSWPVLQCLMDDALESPRGIGIAYSTWSRADAVRNQMGKYRRRQQQLARDNQDPASPTYGTTPYDALSFLIEPNLAGAQVTLTWNWPEIAPVASTSSLLDYSPGDLPAEARKLLSACTLSIVFPDNTTLVAANAPSFKDAWTSIHRRVPVHLLLVNAYDTSHLNISQL